MVLNGIGSERPQVEGTKVGMRVVLVYILK